MHLGPEQISSYLAGTLSGPETNDVEAHIDGCASCRELVSETVRQRYDEQVALAQTQPTSKLELPASAGQIIDGRYRVERLLGVGGMGCVFEAHHLTLNQRVALKFMLPQYARDKTAVDRFTREARAAVRLVTEHVGRVIDLGALPDGTPFLVMELLVGETLEARLSREGPFPAKLATELMCDALDALAEAHALGIIHRDFKPANLFLARRSSGGEVLKVLDFGVAKSIHPDIEAGLGTTSAATIVGSPLYMAPEQLVPGRSIDARADLWAVGCTLYQLLTGEPPFGQTDLVELMYAIQSRPHVPLTKHRSELGPLSTLIEDCLQKEPHRRPVSALALKERLKALTTTETAAPVPTKTRFVVPFALVATAAAVFFALRSTPVAPTQTPTPAPVEVVREPLAPVAAVVPPPVPTPAPAPVPVEVDAGAPVIDAGTIVRSSRPPRVKPPVAPVAAEPVTPPSNSVLDDRL